MLPGPPLGRSWVPRGLGDSCLTPLFSCENQLLLGWNVPCPWNSLSFPEASEGHIYAVSHNPSGGPSGFCLAAAGGLGIVAGDPAGYPCWEGDLMFLCPGVLTCQREVNSTHIGGWM